MKNDKKTWQHLDDLMLSDQQKKKLLRNMTEPSVISKQTTEMDGKSLLCQCYL